MGWAKRTDANHAEVGRILRRLGWRTVDTSRLGDGAPDYFAAKSGRVVAIEVKTATGKVNRRQRLWHEWWPAETAVVRSADDVIALEGR